MKHVHGTNSLKPVGHILIELLFLINCSLIVRVSVVLRRTLVVCSKIDEQNIRGWAYQNDCDWWVECNRGWNKKTQAFIISPTFLAVVGQSDFTNDWHQVDNGKFATSRDRKWFLYILPAEFHNTGWWTRYSVYRVISKRLWIHTQRTPHATSIILEIISISSVSLVNFVNKCASLSSAKNPRCHNSEELGQRELATHYGITLLSWRDILCPVNLADGIRKAIIRLGMVIDNHLHNDIKEPAQITLMQIRYFKKILQRTSQQLFCAKSPMKDSSFTSSSILVTNPHCWASTNSCGVRFCVFA